MEIYLKFPVADFSLYTLGIDIFFRSLGLIPAFFCRNPSKNVFHILKALFNRELASTSMLTVAVE